MWLLRPYVAMLPRLEAQEALQAAQVAMLPHYSGTKSNKQAGNIVRQKVIGAWRRLARGRDDDVTVLRGSQQVKEWFGGIRWGRPVAPV